MCFLYRRESGTRAGHCALSPRDVGVSHHDPFFSLCLELLQAVRLCGSSDPGAQNKSPDTEPCELSSSLDLLSAALCLLFFVRTFLLNCVSFLASISSSINMYIHIQEQTSVLLNKAGLSSL